MSAAPVWYEQDPRRAVIAKALGDYSDECTGANFGADAWLDEANAVLIALGPQTPVPAEAEPDRLLLEHGGETVDEFVCHGVTVHGEVTSDECYWIGITKSGGRALMVNIVGSGLVCHVEDEGEGEGEWPWGEVREHGPDVPQADVPVAPVPAGDPAERIAQAIHADWSWFADTVDPDEYHAGVTHGLSRAMSIARSIAGAR